VRQTGSSRSGFATEVRPALHRALACGDSPGRLLAALNDGLTGQGGRDRFVTAVAVRIDARLRTAEVACAGHLGPFVRRAGGFAEGDQRRDGRAARPAAGRDLRRDDALELEAGDALVLVTDGITDPLSNDDDPLGSEGFIQRLEALAIAGDRAAHDAARLCHALLDDGDPRRDDATVLVLQLPGRELVTIAA